MQISNFHNVVACRYLRCNFKNVYPFSVLGFLFYRVSKLFHRKKVVRKIMHCHVPLQSLYPPPTHLLFHSFLSNSSILFELYEQKIVTTFTKNTANAAAMSVQYFCFAALTINLDFNKR